MKNDFSKILRDVFSLDPKWVDWFMADVYKEEELSASLVESRPAAVLLSTPYRLDFHGQQLECSYISCVATVPSQRGKGLMRGLMRDTLAAAWEKETPFAALIPASRPLYFIYDRMGFATTVYTDEERYTALHEFNDEGYTISQPDYQLFRELEDGRPGGIRHDESQFRNILSDLKLSNGFAAAAVSADGSSKAIVFAEVGSEIKILDVMATDDAAAEAAMAEARRRGGDKPVLVWAYPTEKSHSLRPRAMMRIIHAPSVLEAVAKANPKLKATIRLRDQLIPANNGIYRLENGGCKRVESAKQTDLDVKIDVLAKIIFSDPAVGDLFNLSTRRPFISLMLD